MSASGRWGGPYDPVSLKAALAPLETLYEAKRGKALPLPAALARLYGRLRMPPARSRPHVISNFVTSLDGVVSLNEKGHLSGGDISGFSAQDRMVMGLLRAIVDVVIIGSGTLAADRRDIWTAERIFPGLAADYRRLRAKLGKRSTPLMVVVSGGGELDLRLPVFASGEMRSLILTSAAGAKRLRRQRIPASVEIRAMRGGGVRGEVISPKAILGAAVRASGGKLVLVEGGPRLLGDFLDARLLDEQFLTLSPQIVGRIAGDPRLGLVMGRTFAPRSPRWGSLIDVRRGRSHLFLRYSFTA
jgi:riboflavin biosynthesis pyrimidine reductase